MAAPRRPKQPKTTPKPTEKFDHLVHFDGHGPGWKLAALVVWKLPLILPAMAGLVSAVGGLWWWFR
jgi:hypothetical protein